MRAWPRTVVGLAFLLIITAPSQAQSRSIKDGFVTTPDGARLHYIVEGSGKDTIIAIHGGPGVDLESIRGDFTPLTRNHGVIFYDQRGTGGSTLPSDTTRLTATQQVQDLESIRAHFKVEHVMLVAHSYGPLLAATYAIAHPDRVRSMVFFGPVPPRRGDFWTRFGQSFATKIDSASRRRMSDANKRMNDPKADQRQGCRDYWAEAVRPRLAEPDRTRPLIKSDFCAASPQAIAFGLTTTNRVVMGSYGDWDIRQALKAVRAPTLVVHGEQESIPMDLVEEWVTALPNARLVKVPRAAHFTYLERPEIVWPAVDAFLKQ
ncbi:MAG: alpha/beta hydrolase [bacterium]